MRFLILFSFAVLAVFVSLISMGVTHAAVTVDGPYIDTTTQGDWRNTFASGGSCFYLLPKPPEVKFVEYPIDPKDPNDPGHYCSGGSFTKSGKLLSWDMFSLNGGSTVRPMYVWYFDPTDPVTETRPLSDGTHPADQWNPCVNQGSGGFLGATFDNGDNVNGYFQPMVSEVSVDVIGSLRVAYYFLEEFKDHCRKQTYKLFINGTEYAAGSVMDLDTGKYVYFNIDGLSGSSTIRFEINNTNYDWLDPYPCLSLPPDVPGAGDPFNVNNIHFSGIFIDQCCTGAIGNYVWNDANKNGIQDASEMPLSGVTVKITGPNGYSNSMQTNAQGFYQFTGLCPGTYFVSVTTPAGYSPTACGQGGDPTKDSNCAPATTTLTTEFPSDNTIDFGFYKMMMCPGTGTPGYWKNHPEAWPVASITIGGKTYTKTQAIALISCGDGNKLFTLFRSLVAAKLNVLMGCGGSCINGTILKADAWMAKYAPNGMPLTCGGKPIVYADSKAWKVGEPLYWTLDKYNNGQLYVSGTLCAPSR